MVTLTGDGFPTADREELARFVNALFRYADEGGFAQLRAFRDDFEGTWNPQQWPAVKLDDVGLEHVVEAACAFASRCAAAPEKVVFASPIATFQTAGGAAEKDIANGVALSVDCDENGKAAREKLENLLGPATVVVASGGEAVDPETAEVSPKLHLHWRLIEPTREFADHVRLKELRRLAKIIAGSDGTAVPLVHPLRWPGSWHRKGSPRLARIVAFSPEREIDLGDAIDRLREAVDGMGHRPPEERKGSSEPQADPLDIAAALAVIPNKDLPWDEWNKVGMATWRASGGSELGFAAFAAWSEKSGKHSLAETRARWGHYSSSPPTEIGAGTLFWLAKQHRPDWQKPSDATKATPQTADARPPEFSDEALALRFAAKYSDELRYVAAWGKWFLWRGTHWKPDDTLRAFDLARAICRVASAELLPEKAKLAAQIASAKTVAAVVQLARADRHHAATVDQWDTDPWRLNTPGGIMDLRTGILAPHDRFRYMTKITAVSPSGDCPLWLAFLKRITGDNQEIIKYLQRVAGYALTGSIREHAMFFLWGTGANGKGVFLGTLMGIFGDYATTAPMTTFIDTQTQQHPTDLAGLRGARLVTAQETQSGRRWDETKIKAMTGGDKISARFMRQDFFEYLPEFTLMIAGNNKPGLRSVDEASKRRINLIPFTVTIPEGERDKDLAEKLREEWPGILQWMIEGCLDWQAKGLSPPPAVRGATDEYLESEDTFNAWIEECCVTGKDQWGIGARLWNSWRAWADANNERPGTRKAFAENMPRTATRPPRAKAFAAMRASI